MDTLTIDELKRFVKYDPETGIFKRLIFSKFTKYGDRADIPHHQGYRQVSFNKRAFMAHRLAWFYMTGEWPEKELQVDHINRVRDDNRWCNLRLATASQNRHNSTIHKNNLLGIKGVYIAPNGKFRVMIGLGTFNTLEEAKSAYIDAARKIHGEFFNTDILDD